MYIYMIIVNCRLILQKYICNTKIGALDLCS